MYLMLIACYRIVDVHLKFCGCSKWGMVLQLIQWKSGNKMVTATPDIQFFEALKEHFACG